MSYVMCYVLEARAHGSFRNLQLSALVRIVTQGGVLICEEGEPLSSGKVAPQSIGIKPPNDLA
jgi:hypothetical protein